MPCWSEEKGFHDHQARRRRDGVLCHVRDSRNGEGKVDEGNTAKPKVFCEDMLSTSPQNHKEKQRNTKKQKLFLFRTIKS